jgi:hypothetical protein
MLTSYPLLLGSLVAAFCAIGIVSPEAYAQSAYFQSATNQSFNQGIDQALGPDTQPSLPQTAVEPQLNQQAGNVCYRGSGRVEDEPADHHSSQPSAIAHRGSGRVSTLFL